ncbi:MAG: cation diffusion facilitator family transporter [Deltaproteobacteria bacterium]|nr:cation diffusion facilitator family transporter [Deltaproteobacteria bacterium]
MDSADQGIASSVRLTAVTIAGSVAMAPLLYVVHRRFHSQLALGQAADSLADALGGLGLLWALKVASRAADDEHPLGHSRAEPIAALVVAVLVGVLAVEVLQSALAGSQQVQVDTPLALAFVVKIVFKSTMIGWGTVLLRARRNPVIEALRTDALSDVWVCIVSLVGVLAARLGWSGVDRALGVLLAGYIAWAGLRIARENIALLMGTAPSAQRQRELLEVVRSVDGVLGVDRLIAISHGAALNVLVDLTVDPARSLVDAHALGHDVEALLMAQEDVQHVRVHVGPQSVTEG